MTEYLPASQELVAETLLEDIDPEAHPRAFRIESMPLGESTLRLVSLEANSITDPTLVPPDWEGQVAEVMESADLTLVEYFTPELRRNIPYLDKLRSYSRRVTDTYDRIANMAHALGKDVAVADIANRPLYEAYRFGVVPVIGAAAVASARRGGPLGWAGYLAGSGYVAHLGYQAARKRGVYAVVPSRSERYLPDMNDARHVLTAEGIARTVQEYPPGSSLVYVAAPAHVARVRAMLERPPTVIDSAKSTLYNHLAGLDKDVRIYTPCQDGWERKPAALPHA